MAASGKPASRWMQRIACAVAATALTGGGTMAQAPKSPFADTVSWSVSAQPGAVKPGSQVAVTLQGNVVEGWHVYSLEQLPDGPTPLRVTLEKSDIATSAGAVSASAPIKEHDTSFNLETQYYAKPFTVTVPVKIAASTSAGAQAVPVSVRFQTCNGRVCQPPKTVRLTASINVQPAG